MGLWNAGKAAIGFGAVALVASCTALTVGLGIGAKKVVDATPEEAQAAGEPTGRAIYGAGSKAAHFGKGVLDGMMNEARDRNPEAAQKVGEAADSVKGAVRSATQAARSIPSPSSNEVTPPSSSAPARAPAPASTAFSKAEQNKVDQACIDLGQLPAEERKSKLKRSPALAEHCGMQPDL